MCPLQIINDIEYLSLTLHGVNETFIHNPSNVENYLIGHKSQMGRFHQIKATYFYTSWQIFDSLQKFANFFNIWEIGTYCPTKQPSGDMVKNPK